MLAQFLSLLGLPLAPLLLLCVLVLVAGAIRGYSGFGMSAVIITVASMWIPPVKLVATLYCLEICASILMLGSVARDADKKLVATIFVGTLIGMPLGQQLLLLLPPDITRLGLYSVVVMGAFVMRTSYAEPLAMSAYRAALIGLLSGIASGLASLGGLVAMALLIFMRYDVIKARATLVVLFFFSSLYGLSLGAFNGITDIGTLLLAGILIIPLFAGVALGKRCFSNASKQVFRRRLLSLLAMLAIAGAVRAGISLTYS